MGKCDKNEIGDEKPWVQVSVLCFTDHETFIYFILSPLLNCLSLVEITLLLMHTITHLLTYGECKNQSSHTDYAFNKLTSQNSSLVLS